MTEALDSKTQGDEPPDAAPQVASGRTAVIAVSMAALAVIGAATANSLPSLGPFSLPDFNWFSSPSAYQFSLPDFSRFTPTQHSRVAASPQPTPAPQPAPAPVLVPDPVVRAGLRDIQTSQEQHSDVLMSLMQSSGAQQADLKRITRQLSLLTAQVSSLQNAVPAPLTTSSIPLSTTTNIRRPNPRTRVIHASRKVHPPVLPPATLPATLPSLPKPVGPVSVGGAPLAPAPAAGPGTS